MKKIINIDDYIATIKMLQGDSRDNMYEGSLKYSTEYIKNILNNKKSPGQDGIFKDNNKIFCFFIDDDQIELVNCMDMNKLYHDGVSPIIYSIWFWNAHREQKRLRYTSGSDNNIIRLIKKTKKKLDRFAKAYNKNNNLYKRLPIYNGDWGSKEKAIFKKIEMFEYNKNI